MVAVRVYDKPRQCIKKQRHHFANKVQYSQSYGFSSSHIWMWELNHKEGWALKNWCFWTVVLEGTLESPLDCKEIKRVNPKGNQPWEYSLERLMLKLKLQYFGHLKQRADSLEKTPMLGKDREREREKTDRETESIWDERMRKRSLTWLWLFNKTPTLEGQSHGKPFQSFWFLPINFQTLWLLWTSKKFTQEHTSH